MIWEPRQLLRAIETAIWRNPPEPVPAWKARPAAGGAYHRGPDPGYLAGAADPAGHEPGLYDTAVDRPAAGVELLGAQGLRSPQPDRTHAAEVSRAARSGRSRSQPPDHTIHPEHERRRARVSRPRAAPLYRRIAHAEDRGVVQLHLAHLAAPQSGRAVQPLLERAAGGPDPVVRCARYDGHRDEHRDRARCAGTRALWPAGLRDGPGDALSARDRRLHVCLHVHPQYKDRAGTGTDRGNRGRRAVAIRWNGVSRCLSHPRPSIPRSTPASRS